MRPFRAQPVEALPKWGKLNTQKPLDQSSRKVGFKDTLKIGNGSQSLVVGSSCNDNSS